MARESAQPALKGAAVIAAAGGLVATFATPASADPLSVVDTSSAPVTASTAAVGPTKATGRTSTPQAGVALASLGFVTATKARKLKPVVIEDLVVKAERAEAARVVAAQARAAAAAKAERAAAAAKAERAAAAAKAERAAAEKAAADEAARLRRQSSSQTTSHTSTRTTSRTSSGTRSQRASRSTSRSALTSKPVTKSSSNSYSPSASSGTKGSHNWASAGQCTWGALSQWYGSEGYYPAGWTGNALAWGYGAARAGYTVSSTPRTRSILVMQPGVHGSSSYAGHVAWVTAVNGNQVTVIEMNALAGAYRYNTRTLSNIGGMQYIYAP